MNFEKPTSEGYTLYTKSKCPYCIKVKELLKDVVPEPRIIDCDSYLTEPKVKEDFLSFIQSINGKIDHRTFPMVFYNGQFIGGFTDTQSFFEKERAFSELSFDF